MSFKHSLLALGVASTFLLTGCGGSGGPGEPRLNVPEDPTRDQTEQQGFCNSSTTEFSITEFVPADGALDVAVNSNVRITFNANVDADSVPGNVRLLDGVNEIVLEDGSPRIVGRSVVLNPLGDLNGDTTYTIQALSGLQADCGDSGSTKSLVDSESSSFTTGSTTEQDTTGPMFVAASPSDGETMATTDSRIFVEFDEPIDPSSVDDTTFIVQELDDSGNVVGLVSGAFNVVGNSVEFTPNQALKGQTFYRIIVEANITDLAGNPGEASSSTVFRTGGLVLALNEGVVSQIPGLGEALNDLAGTLLDPLAFGDSEDGLNSLDNALILKLPLIDGLSGVLNGGALPSQSTNTIDGVDFLSFLTGVIAVCDPKSVNNGEPGADCTLALDLGLGQSQIFAFADAFTGGNPEQVPDLLLGLIEGLASGDLGTVPPELADLFEENNRGLLQLKVLEDNSVPLPQPLEDGLLTVLDAVGQIPVLGELTSQQDAKALADIGLLKGSLIRVNLGGLASITVLDGFETFVGPNGVLNLGGALFDTLLELSPIGGGNGGTPSREDLPLIGDLLTLLDAGNFFGGDGFDPSNLPIIGELSGLLNLGDEFGAGDIPVLGTLLSALDPNNIGEGDLPLIGDLLSLLNPDTITNGDLPIIGDLFEQLLSLGQDGGTPLDDLPLVGEFVNLLQGGAAESPLGDILDPSMIQEIPVLGPVLDRIVGGLLGALAG